MSRIVQFLPVITFAVLTSTWFGTYVAAIAQYHIEGAFPYISETATTPPESCYFGQFMNIGSALAGVVFSIRYFQVDELVARHPEIPAKVARMNSISVWLGFGMSLGLSVASNFQTSNGHYLHVLGGAMVFSSGLIYFPMQTACTFHLQRFTGCAALGYSRLVLTTVIIVGTVIFTHTQRLANAAFKGKNTSKWFPEDGGYDDHIISSSCQWVTVFCISLFLLSYYGDFRHLSFARPQIILLKDLTTGNEVQRTKVPAVRKEEVEDGNAKQT